MLKFWQNYRQLARRQQIVIASVFGVVLALILTVSSVASYRYFKQQKINETPPETTSINLSPPLILDDSQIDDNDKKELNVLLLGYGGAGHQGGMLTDIIQVAHFDFVNKKISFISIPRDLEVEVSEGLRKKINSIFSYGLSGDEPFNNAGQITKKAIAQLTGLNVKYFIAVDFVGFKRLIGQTLGSIEVQVSQTLDDPWYPIEGEQLNPCDYSPEEIAQMTNTLSGFALESKFACRYQHLYFEPGIHQMQGEEALGYVRSRHSSSDFDRSRRQVEVLTAIRKKLFDLNVLAKIPAFFAQVSQQVQTDFDLETLEYLAPLLSNANQFAIKSINLSTENVLTSTSNNNGFVLVAKDAGTWSSIHQFIQDSLNK